MERELTKIDSDDRKNYKVDILTAMSWFKNHGLTLMMKLFQTSDFKLE